jgi:hypothetical protein
MTDNSTQLKLYQVLAYFLFMNKNDFFCKKPSWMGFFSILDDLAEAQVAK